MQGLEWKTDRQSLCQIGCEIMTRPREERTIRELQELNENERKIVWADMSGNSAMTPEVEEQRGEDPEFVFACLDQLEEELNKIQKKDAYDEAVQMDEQFVENEEFQMMFLRSELYDAELAATRLVGYFQEKLVYFGRDKLVKTITIDDLDDDDRDALFSGNMQILPQPDHAGRKVIFFYKAFIEGYKKRENMLRTAWVLFQLAVEDIQSQKLGVIVVVYNLGGFPKGGNDWEKSRRLSQVMKALPIRFDAFLPCFDDVIWDAFVRSFSFMVSRFLRVRFRPLSGSRQEISYKLMAMGVPYFGLPVTSDNKLLKDEHLKRMVEERRKARNKRQWEDQMMAEVGGGKRDRDSEAPGMDEDDEDDEDDDDTEYPKRKSPRYIPSSAR